MRIRSFIGLLLSVAAVVYAAVLHAQNRDLFHQRFHLGPETTIPVWGALIAIFLAGFLPTGATLVFDTLRRDLAQRRERRHQREQGSLDATFRRAVDFQADGQPAKAAAELESYLAGRPEDFPGLLAYGAVLRALGRVGEAIEVHRRAGALHPGSVALLYQLAEDYAVKGDAAVTREIEGRIVRDFAGLGLEVLKRRRAEALARQDWAQATEAHDRVAQILNETGDAATLARETHLAQGLDYQRGVLMLEADRAEEASAVFRRLLEREPRFIPARIMLGEAALLRFREEEAVAAWREGYLETGSPVFLQRIEDYYIEEEEPRAAIETLRALMAAADNDLLPRFYLGRLYFRLEMHDEALKILGSIGERIRSSPTFHFLVGRIHERRGELAEAVDSYVACLRQLDLGSAEYSCRVCHLRTPDWRDYCVRCGSWNAVELDFEEERLSAEELGVLEVPVWGGVDGDSGEFSVPPLEPVEER
jgi:lipopolysaccharide biosynthesis regulator YciM